MDDGVAVWRSGIERAPFIKILQDQDYFRINNNEERKGV